MPKVDASDGISVTGHSHTLMFTVRSAGLKLHQKGWKNLNAKEKCFAELFLNSIVDINDERSLKELGFDITAVEQLQQMFPSKSVNLLPSIDERLDSVMKEVKQMSTSRERYNAYLILSTKYENDLRKKLDILAYL
ncbi:unnamed protein product [Mucor hiemalis]